MANNFSTLKLNQAVEKFIYVRLEPARYVNDDLTSIGGGKYTIDLSGFFVSQVLQNSTSLTSVTSTPNSGEYYFNESTGLLTIYPTSTPSSTVSIIVYYYLFFTSGSFPTYYEDPEDTMTPLRNWLQRVTQSPPLENSIKNILAGVLTINSSSLSIVNSENDLNVYFGINDSWYNKNIKVWTCIDDPENIQKVFDGTITGVSLDKKTISITIEDLSANLSGPAFMGDAKSETYITFDDYPNIKSDNANKAIPIIFGTVSRYQTIPETITNLTTAEKIDPTSVNEAFVVDYTTNISTSNNRQWIAARTADGYLDFSCTPSAVSNTDPNYTRLTVNSSQIYNFHIGDTFIITYSAVDYYLRVYYVDRVNNYLYTTKQAAISTGAVISAAKIPVVIVSNRRDETYYLLYGRDYTVTETATSGGHYLYKIVLANNFEANHPGLTVLDTGLYSVLYRIKPDTTNGKHGSVLKTLLESTGLIVNSSSVTTANTSLTSLVNFSIPQFDEGDFAEYFKYIELILSSTFGYIFLNNSFEIEYKLFQAPSSTTEINDGIILKDSLSYRFEFKDIITQLIGYNSHYAANEVTSMSATPSVTVVSNKAKYLHGIDNTTRFRHVLQDMSTRLQDIMDFRSERLVTYDFETANRHLDALIGDDFKLTTSGLLGDDTSRQVKLIKVNKNTDKVSISAIDLIGN